MKKIHRIAIYIITILVILTIFACYIISNLSRLQTLFQLSLDSVTFLILFISCSLLIAGRINYHLYGSLGVAITWLEGVSLVVIKNLGNLLPLSGGLFAKGVYLKQRHNLTYQLYFPSSFAISTLFLGIHGVTGLFGLSWLWFIESKSVSFPLWLGFAGMTMVSFLLWMPLEFKFLPASWNQKLIQTKAGWQCLSENPRLTMKLAGLQLLWLLFVSGRFYLVFHIFSQDVQYVHCLLFASVFIIASLITIVPGGLGVRESMVGGLGSVLGFDFGVGAVAVGLDRVFTILVMILIGVVLTQLLTQRALINQGRK